MLARFERVVMRIAADPAVRIEKLIQFEDDFRSAPTQQRDGSYGC
jgi:hypothetical protein